VNPKKSRRRYITTTNATLATAAEPTWTTALSRPTNRFGDKIFYEVELIPHLTTEDFLATAGIVIPSLRGEIVWMTPEVYVCTNKNIGIHTYSPGSHLCIAVTPNTPDTAAD
jgi:hypothetical protein